MDFLRSMLGMAQKTDRLNKDDLADVLKADKTALEQFEQAYKKNVLSQDPDEFFDTNSRQASEQLRMSYSGEAGEQTEELKQRIVNELLAQTSAYVFDGHAGKTLAKKALPADVPEVTKEEIAVLPQSERPQLTGSLMPVDIHEPSYPHLLYFYQRAQTAKSEKERRDAYNRFRQGLDILDLDEVTYQVLGTNKNSMGYWLPALVEACKGQNTFKIPATTVVKVPLPLLQLTRKEYRELTKLTLDIVDEWAYQAFHLNENKDYFIKTGTYSSKFDFRNARVKGPKEVRELGEYLLYIHFQALQMAGPLSHPCIYGVSTTNEWVVREYIEDKENNPTIYKGLPLHTEFRVFVDCDNDTIIGKMPYWEPETMKKRFGHSPDANSPHQMHDYVVYKAHEDVLMKRYEENLERVLRGIEEILPSLDLQGQWSIDVMLNGEGLWIIDMALAEQSAFYDCVPYKLRNPSVENWIPSISANN